MSTHRLDRCDQNRRGLSRMDVLAIIISAAALLAILTIVLFRLGPQSTIRVDMRDGTNLRNIHQGMHLFASESQGLYPRPGLIRRKPIEVDGELMHVPGRGDEDTTLNTTDRMYSSLIAMRYISAELLVSPGEVNPVVQPMRDFDYDAYAPTQHSYWDERFAADLEQGSNVSYAHMLLFGERKYVRWNQQAPSQIPLVSSRGPRDGVPDPNSYTCDRQGQWRGMVVRNDNTTMLYETMSPPELVLPRDDAELQDNLFAIIDGIDGEDVVLTFTIAIDDDGPHIQHD